MIIPENVQRAVHHEPDELLPYGNPGLPCIAQGDSAANVDVAVQFPVPASEGKADHVGGVIVAQVLGD